jgi:nitrous oxide reductase accessory protein NosL
VRVALLALAMLGIAVAGPGAAAGDRAALVASPADKCPVCGMFVKRYPDWIAAARLRGGGQLVFDGAKDLFRWWLEPGRYTPGRTQADVEALLVTDYYDLRAVDARAAWFVAGSDVLGPMGHELVPFASEVSAREFLADHHGRQVLRFGEVTPALVKGLE